MQETWKPIRNFETYYEVSNTGKVRSLDRLIKTPLKYNDFVLRVGKNISIKNANTGYKFVILYKNGKQKTGLIHRLVADAFLENTENKKAVNHIDCDKSNNNLSNLEWVTYKENKDHARKHGLIAKGETCGASKLNESEVMNIRKYKGVLSGRKTAVIFNISSTNIFDIWNRKIWAHLD